MLVNQETVSVQEILWELADPDSDYFHRTFRHWRELFPDLVAEACLYYLAEKGLTPSGHEMAAWLSLGNRYLQLLFEQNALPLAVATKAAAALSQADPAMPAKFLEAVEQISSPEAMMRPLSLLTALTDYTALLPWLGELSNSVDGRVRSRAVKLLCPLQPESREIEKQMHDGSPRVRANVIEGLWKSSSPETSNFFKAALSDENHRVVGNALVGLYLRGDASALDKMIELCDSSDASFRAAMAWSLGFIKDQRGLPALQRLSTDQSMNVRKHAISSLVLLRREAWQRAVREQFEALREARSTSIDLMQLDELKRRHTLLIDVAFTKLRAAEENEAKFAAAHAGQFVRLICTA
jgi:HEAT repeat protein